MAPLLEWESDDVLAAVFARVPLLSQGALRAISSMVADLSDDEWAFLKGKSFLTKGNEICPGNDG